MKCKQCGNDFNPVLKYGTKIVQSRICSSCRIENNKILLSNGHKLGNLNTSRFKKGNTPQKKKVSKKSLKMRQADLWFSRYIRIKYAYKIQDGNVYCQCIVHKNIIKLAKNMDNGHCFSRGNMATRYEEDNCRPQNRGSNRYSGEKDHYIFIDRLKNEIGEERFNRIEQLRKSNFNGTTLFFSEQAEKYKFLVKQLVEEKNIKKWW